MKLATFILLCCFSVYITETIKAPINSGGCAKKTTCCAMKMKEVMQKANHQEKPAGKCNSKNCTNPGDCTNCPLCYVTILEPSNPMNLIGSFYKKQYPVINNHHISDYASESWKPPNVG